MKKYRLYLSVLLAVFAAAFSDISAQYRIIGFEGMDTVDLGIAEQRGGKFVLPKNIAKYTKIELVAVSQTYADTERHLRRLQKAYLDKSRELISTEITYITDHLDFATLYYSPIYTDYLVSWLSGYNFVATSVADFEQRLSADAVGTISRLR